MKRGRAWRILDDMVLQHCAGTKSLSSGYGSLHVRVPFRDAIYYMLRLGELGLSLALRSGEASASAMSDETGR